MKCADIVFTMCMLLLIYIILTISAAQQNKSIMAMDIYLHIYTCISIPFLILPSIKLYQKRLDIVPCAVQQDLMAYLLQMQ